MKLKRSLVRESFNGLRQIGRLDIRTSVWKRNSTSLRTFNLLRTETGYVDHEPHVLYEDNSCLIINKPSGMASHPTEIVDFESRSIKKLMPILGADIHKHKKDFKNWKQMLLKKNLDIITYFKILIKVLDDKKGNVYLAPANRLDQPASGLMILAKKSKIVERFQQEYKNGSVEKEYLAIVAGDLTGYGEVPAGTTSYDEFWKNRSVSTAENLTRVVSHKKGNGNSSSKVKDGKLSWTAIHQFPVVERKDTFQEDNKKQFRTVVGVRCESGKKHQVRRQLAAIGFPIVGDWLYGSKSRIMSGNRMLRGGEKILLHASKIKIRMPTNKREVKEFLIPPPKDFLRGANMDISEFGNRYYDLDEAKRISDLKEQ